MESGRQPEVSDLRFSGRFPALSGFLPAAQPFRPDRPAQRSDLRFSGARNVHRKHGACKINPGWCRNRTYGLTSPDDLGTWHTAEYD